MPRPLYIFAKPPAEQALEAEQRRRELGIQSGYHRDRFHTTILPICDARDAPSGLVRILEAAFASLIAEPCTILYDRIHRNALRGGRALRDLRDLQNALAERLAALGLSLPHYLFRPHMSLAYGAAPGRIVAIQPIAWRVNELLLVESIHGEGRHETLARFALIQRQGSLGF